MGIPRFARRNLNPSLVLGNIGKAFEEFACQVLRADYPALRLFPSRGKDGAIDLIETAAGARTVVECKFIGKDGLAEAQRRWREVADKLAAHLAAPDGPAKGQAQYGPWYRTEPRIAEFVFCISSELSNQEQIDQLHEKITHFFSDLVEKHEHLAHLRELSVRVLDWNYLCDRLRQRPHLLFHWFPNTRPLGLVPLAESPDRGTFRSYLTRDRLPYYSRKQHLESKHCPTEVKILDEGGLLALLEDDRTTGLVVTGSGGVGKTRLTQEIADLAEEKGWLVLRVGSRLRSDALQHLADSVTPDTPVLLLFDYVETQRDFAEVEQAINDLNDTYPLKLCYVASCRTSYYRALPASSRRQRIDLSVQDAELEWLEGYRRETVRHILEHGDIQVTEEHLAVCQDVPIFAVFILYLQTTGREADLAALLKEKDFGTWVNKRVQLSFGDIPCNRKLALLTSLFPLPNTVFCSTDQDQFGNLPDILATDGWVEKLSADEPAGSAVWVTAHDVLADQIVLSYLRGIPRTVERFVDELLSLASGLGCLRSALHTLQRVADYPPLTALDWTGVLGRKMRDDATAWREVRDLLIRTSLLTPPQRVHFLGEHTAVWEEAWEEVEIQNALGWLARWAKAEAEPGLDEAGHDTLKWWIQKAAPYVTTSNYILSWGLRAYPEAIRDAALDWILTRPVDFQTHYLMVAWLECGFPPHSIRASVEQWTSKSRHTRHLSFVIQAWLDAKGEPDLVQQPIVAWLGGHKTALEARFVYKAWLDAGGEREMVREPITAWLGEHKTAPEADFVYRAWLDVKGEPDLVQQPIAAWLRLHHNDAEASFVYRAWLDAGGEREMVREPIAAWLKEHCTDADAGFVYKAWLDAEGERDLVQQPIAAWLKEHHTDAEAGFVYQAWLDAGGEQDLVRDSIIAWIKDHRTDLEARFVYKAWLDARLEREAVREPIAAWLGEHSTDAEANFLYKAWLDAGGERKMVREPIAAWLHLHSTHPEADFVFKAWLEAGGSFSLVRLPAIRWLSQHCDSAKAVYVTKFLAKQKDIPIETVVDILTWCRTFPTHMDAIWRLRQLGSHLLNVDVAEEVIVTCEAVLEPLMSKETPLKPVVRDQITTLFSYLIAASGLRSGAFRERVDDLLLSWLRTPSSFGTSPAPHNNIQRSAYTQRIVDLVVSGALSVTSDREHLERFLQWVNNWKPERKSQLASMFAFLRHDYPSEGLWDIVEFE
jgi:hypothetical protein